MERLLEVVNLEKRFDIHILNEKRIEALRDVSLRLNEGEIIGLTGKTGSGKSTLMRCIYRTYLATSGRILFRLATGAVIDLAAAPEHDVLEVRRREMTYCSQFLQVIPRVSAIDVVSSALVTRGTEPGEARKQAGSIFEYLSLPGDLWDAYPATFSGGEQQRVNIARAMIARPRLLLVDEPTASLDIRTKDAVIDMLLNLKKYGTSIILITHDAHTLGRMADRTLHLEQGQLNEVVCA